MTFGEALEILKRGACVTRAGWNGKNMHLYLLPKRHDSVNVVLEPCIVMFTAEAKHQPGWLASQADMLATDWLAVGEEPK